MKEPKLLAAANELVTCINHHRVCVTAEDIFEGSVMRRESFKDWAQPEMLENLRNCVVCGSPWIRRNALTGGWQIYVDSEWRPNPTLIRSDSPSALMEALEKLRGQSNQ